MLQKISLTMKRQEKIFVNYISDPEYIENSYNSIVRQIIKLIMHKHLNRHFTKKIYKWIISI